MLATATHDHKRGEDVRARLNVLSERPREWSRRVQRWLRLNRTRRAMLDARPAPGRNDEYLFYQTIVGAWPLSLTPPHFDGMADFVDRIAAYMLKAAREAKQRTGWTAPNAEYEAMLDRFVREALDPARSRYFLASLVEFLNEVIRPGALNGLAQTLFKFTTPGVPDIYQGCERWDLSLVDPDNRRPVDYAVREAALDFGPPSPQLASALLDGWRDGRIKQFVIQQVLALRRQRPALFAAGDYQPLDGQGPQADRIIAFSRNGPEGRIIAVAPRLVAQLLRGEGVPLVPAEQWQGTRLPVPQGASTTWHDIFTGEAITADDDGVLPLERILAHFPVALLSTAQAAA
jgi:(1->4)-alpha-D-glucan 1-alpha-D-glucosylmutase